MDTNYQFEIGEEVEFTPNRGLEAWLANPGLIKGIIISRENTFSYLMNKNENKYFIRDENSIIQIVAEVSVKKLPSKLKCDMGCEAVGAPRHSPYCSKYQKE